VKVLGAVLEEAQILGQEHVLGQKMVLAKGSIRAAKAQLKLPEAASLT
jgi:hypothetical protein